MVVFTPTEVSKELLLSADGNFGLTVPIGSGKERRWNLIS